MKQKLEKLTLVRKNLYRDEHERNLFIDYKKKKIYVINKKDDKKFEYLQMRLLISVLIGIVSSYYLKWWIGLTVGVVLIAVSEWYYNFKFLPSLQIIEVDEFPKKESTVEAYASKGKTINIIRLIIGFAVPFLSAYVCYDKIVNHQTATSIDTALMVLGCAAIAFYGAYTCIFSAKALLYSKSK